MRPIKPRNAQREIRVLLAAADRETLSAAGFIVTERMPLQLLLARLEAIADIVAQYPRTRMAARLRPQVHNALYLAQMLVEDI